MVRIMSYEIEVKEIKSQPIASISAETTIKKIPRKLPKFFKKIMKYLNKNEIQTIGPPVAIYRNFSETKGQVEVGFPIREQIPPKGNIKNSQCPSGKVAFLLYTGGYDKISFAYDAIQDWIKKNSFDYTNIWWEAYLTDPHQEPDQNKWKTEIYLLLDP